VAKPEEKLIIAVHAAENFKGMTLRQVRPRCCGREIDVFDARVNFRDILVGEKRYTLLEPNCPSCGKRVRGQWTILS
jgi:rRNA maturation protein Nop10